MLGGLPLRGRRALEDGAVSGRALVVVVGPPSLGGEEPPPLLAAWVTKVRKAVGAGRRCASVVARSCCSTACGLGHLCSMGLPGLCVVLKMAL